MFETVPVKIKNGHITNPEILKVGDAILFVGSDPSRPKQIGHVEYIYSINKETTTTKPSSTSTSNSAYYPKCNKSYTTLTKALDSVHIDSSKEARAKIAKANGIKNYQFTAEQNNQMLILLKAGKLKSLNKRRKNYGCNIFNKFCSANYCWYLLMYWLCIKNLVTTDTINKYIPLIMAIIGVVLNAWMNMSFTPEILLGGLVSGLASTGLYEVFKNFIKSEK